VSVKRESWVLTEKEFRQYLVGMDVSMHVKIFLDGEQDDWSKDYLLSRVLEVYHARMNQKLEAYGEGEVSQLC
jgi:hypothetical protein